MSDILNFILWSYDFRKGCYIAPFQEPPLFENLAGEVFDDFHDFVIDISEGL